MKLIEKIIVETNRALFQKARENNTLNTLIVASTMEDKEEKIAYLISNKIVTLEEIYAAFNE